MIGCFDGIGFGLVLVCEVVVVYGGDLCYVECDVGVCFEIELLWFSF